MKRRDFMRHAGAAVLTGTVVRALSPRAMAWDRGEGILVERTIDTMGSIASLSLYASDRTAGEAALDAAATEFRRVDRLLSSFNPASPLNAINRAAGRALAAVPPEVVATIASAGTWHACTRGAFDPTVGPLLELYGFLGDDPPRSLPGDREIATRLEAVGFGNVELDPTSGRVGLRREHARLDLGGIGVGIALDRAAAVVRAAGIEAALLNHSGDIAAIGAPPGREGWEIAIQDPFDPRGTVRTFTLRDRCVSTSGDYENFIETDGGRVGHILDPHTGRNPRRFASVSVFADSSIAADALSTGFFAGGVALACAPPAGSGTIDACTVDPEHDGAAVEFIRNVSP